MKGSCLFLGTGASSGTPVVGCPCNVCLSPDPKNQRLRPSVLLEVEGKKLIIDTGPDFRQQALKFGIKAVDGVLYTHSHFDHTSGIDDLRPYYFWTKTPIPCLLSTATFEEIKRLHHYLFGEPVKGKSFGAQLDFQVLEGLKGDTLFAGVQVRHFSFDHGGMKVTGFRIGNLAYICDICQYDDSLFDELQDLDVLILSALRFGTSWLHFNVDTAIAFAERVNAKQTYFTHISHEIEHNHFVAYCPPRMTAAYDGLKIHL